MRNKHSTTHKNKRISKRFTVLYSSRKITYVTPPLLNGGLTQHIWGRAPYKLPVAVLVATVELSPSWCCVKTLLSHLLHKFFRLIQFPFIQAHHLYTSQLQRNPIECLLAPSIHTNYDQHIPFLHPANNSYAHTQHTTTCSYALYLQNTKNLLIPSIIHIFSRTMLWLYERCSKVWWYESQV